MLHAAMFHKYKIKLGFFNVWLIHFFHASSSTHFFPLNNNSNNKKIKRKIYVKFTWMHNACKYRSNVLHTHASSVDVRKMNFGLD